jgi:hypothetical protein
MDLKPTEKVVKTTSSVDSNTPYHAELYDPSKESMWTRLGVNLESSKCAPNTTGYLVHNTHIDYDLHWFILVVRSLLVLAMSRTSKKSWLMHQCFNKK